MTYDSLDVLADFHTQQNLGYPMLHDEQAKHVIGFDVLNEDYEPGHAAYGIPHPGIFFLSPDGVVLNKFAVPGYRQRPPMAAVLEAVRSGREDRPIAVED